MKRSLFLIPVLLAGLTQAKELNYEQATIVSMNSVPCGTQAKGHKKTQELLCHEYVLRSDTTEYHIRQKQEKSSALLPVGQQAQFAIQKDRMKLRYTDKDGKQKEGEFLVVEEEANTPSASSPK